MKLDLAGVFSDAWAMAKRDRDLLIAVGGVFLFLPQLVIAMFVPQPAPLPSLTDQAAIDGWIAGVERWSQTYSLLVIMLALVMQFGALALLRLYLDRDRPDASVAMTGALLQLPAFILVSVLVSIPVTTGLLLLLVLPGVYFQARLMLAAPAFVAERPIGAVTAFRRSLALTRGNTLPMLVLAVVSLLAGDLLAAPFRLIGQVADGAPLANPVVAAVLNVGAAGAVAIGLVATVLLQVAAYRRAVSPSIGI